MKLAFTAILSSLCIYPVVAQETTATLEHAQVMPFEQMLTAHTQALQAAFNALSTSVITCGNQGKVYGPGSASADSNGCVGESIPSNTVAAFRLSACPSGWVAYNAARGRVVVGVGSLSGESYSLGDTGGAAERTLSVAQMPRHRHSFDYRRTTAGAVILQADDSDQAMWQTTTTNDNTGYEGDGDPFDNRQPYLALLYCIKS